MPGPGLLAAEQARQAELLKQKELELENRDANVDMLVKSGDVAGAVEQERARQAAGAPVLSDPSNNFSGLVDGQYIQAEQGLHGEPVAPLSLADAQAYAARQGFSDYQQGEQYDTGLPDFVAQSPVTTPVAKGGAAPNDISVKMSASDAALTASLDKIQQDLDATTRKASLDLLASAGAMEETVAKWQADTADLDPKQSYAELEQGLNEAQLQLDEVRNYFKDLGKRTVDPGRFYANGGGASASVAVAVGALSQAMLGPGAPNTALNIIESAVDRDIRAQEISLQNAQQSGVGMLQALAQSRQILGDKHSALLETRAALRDDMVSKMQQLAIRSNNAVAMNNVSIAAAEAARKSELDRAEATGRKVDTTVTTNLGKLRRGYAANVYQQLKTQADAAGAASVAAQQAAAATPPTQASPDAGLTSAAVAGTPPKSKSVAKQRAAKPLTEQPQPSAQAAGPKPYDPRTAQENDTVSTPDGRVWKVKRLGGRLVPAGAIRNVADALWTTADPVDQQRYAQFLAADPQSTTERGNKLADLEKMPKTWKLIENKSKRAVETIKKYLVENPSAVDINLIGSEGRADLREAVSFLAATRIGFYRNTSGDKSALSIQDIARAMGALPEDVTVVSTADLRAALTAVPDTMQSLKNDMEADLGARGLYLPPAKGEARTQDLVNRAASGGKRSVNE